MRIYEAIIETVGRYSPGMDSAKLAQLRTEIEEDYVKQEGGKEFLVKNNAATPEQRAKWGWGIKLKNFFESPYTRLGIMIVQFIAARRIKHWWLTAGQKSEEEIEAEIRREIEEQRDWRMNGSRRTRDDD